MIYRRIIFRFRFNGKVVCTLSPETIETIEVVEATELESKSKLISCLDESIFAATLAYEFNTIIPLLSCTILQIYIDEYLALFFLEGGCNTLLKCS